MKITGIPTNVATSSVMTKTLVTLRFHQAAIFSGSLFQLPEAACYNYLQSTACNSTELHFAGTLTNIVRIDIGELLLLDASLSSGFPPPPPPPQFFDTVYSPSYFASNGQPTAIDQTKNRIWVRGDQHPSLMLFSWKIDMANQTFCFTRTPLLRQEHLSQFPVRQSKFCQASSLHLLLAEVAELSGRTQLLHQSKFGIPFAKVDLRV
jgi:hypothetical protein